jgi:hypothetical protein
VTLLAQQQATITRVASYLLRDAKLDQRQIDWLVASV